MTRLRLFSQKKRRIGVGWGFGTGLGVRIKCDRAYPTRKTTAYSLYPSFYSTPALTNVMLWGELLGHHLARGARRSHWRSLDRSSR
jgi:hypothetical protein